MASSNLEHELNVRATGVKVTDQTITVELEDGRSVVVPTAWYPRLLHATPKERRNYEISPFGIEWPDVEADFSIRGLLLGRKSGECNASLDYWLENRKKGKRTTVEEFLKKQSKERQRGRQRRHAA